MEKKLNHSMDRWGNEMLPGQMVRCSTGTLELSHSNHININQGFRITILDLCLSLLNEKIGFDNRFLISLILNNLQKAFNTMNHGTFLGKLHPIGFCFKTITWFESYLPDQIFWLNINNYLIMWCSTRTNLSPLMLLSHVNIT